MFDKDGNGVIEMRELRHVMMNLGENITDEELDAILEDADRDKDGFIVYDGEFIITLMYYTLMNV